MEDEDEFGDLYTDVMRPFSSSLSSSPQPQEPSPSSRAHRPPIDLNHKGRDDDDEDDVDMLLGAYHRTAANPTDRNPVPADNILNSAASIDKGVARVVASAEAKKFPEKHPNLSDLDEHDVNFDIEEGDAGIFGEDSGSPLMTMIPGLAEEDSRKTERDASGCRAEWRDEEDSDSDDDLQIVLNDANPVGIERRGVIGDGDEEEDDDEDGDPLVIVTDGGPVQGTEEQEWGGSGEDASGVQTGMEGEKKEGSDIVAGKGSAVVVGPKIGYSNHGYHHPFHSQFKVSNRCICWIYTH